jgi:hypothetical protein
MNDSVDDWRAIRDILASAKYCVEEEVRRGRRNTGLAFESALDLVSELDKARLLAATISMRPNENDEVKFRFFKTIERLMERSRYAEPLRAIPFRQRSAPFLSSRKNRSEILERMTSLRAE